MMTSNGEFEKYDLVCPAWHSDGTTAPLVVLKTRVKHGVSQILIEKKTVLCWCPAYEYRYVRPPDVRHGAGRKPR